MRLSHSKLKTILTCPMTYYLKYIKKIFPRVTKDALNIGSAVHYGIENNTYNLSEYFKKEDKNFILDGYKEYQVLAEAMVLGYLKNKKFILNKILEECSILEEFHELELTCPISSRDYDDHLFTGIIDLLLLTNKGFIIIDFKTSSREPNWDNHLDQLYRYVRLLEHNFPEFPVYKIGIINIKKTGIRLKKGESTQSFMRRLQTEYEINDGEYIKYHIYEADKFNKEKIKHYFNNLSLMCDMAETIHKDKLFYINYKAAEDYGRSEYWDMFYRTPGAEVLYNVKDVVLDKETNTIVKFREANKLDMKVVELDSNILNSFENFKYELENAFEEDEKYYDKENFINYLKKFNYEYDKSLIDLYWETYIFLLENEISDLQNDEKEIEIDE